MNENNEKIFRCGNFRLSLDRPLIMGIVNLTPDSFSGDGLAGSTEAALAHARAQWEAGADILDLGAESTRPGAPPVSVREELARLLPVLEKIRAEGWNVPVSIDTMKPETMRAALAAGADFINDINGLRTPGALDAVAGSDCAICLMHMQGEPRTMQLAPNYDDVVSEVAGALVERARAVMAAGIARSRIVLDPGFGFGKSVAHNYSLLKHLERFTSDGFPVLAGLSRKTMLGAVTGAPPEKRLIASVAAAVLAAERGAGIVRVHDVAATAEALKIWRACAEAA
ncbi:MAG: dihydropteroate synthase [Azoarcus sp.]|jgi:dihydropteroate synthase|nr:dihydropteroate synthase [Azoarcus sp.]